MKVVRLYTDVDRWSTLMPEDEDEHLFNLEKSKRRARRWKVPTVRVSAVSRAKHGDFRDLHSAQWAVTPAVAAALGPWFESAGELLPIKADDGTDLFWFNCTTVIDAFDWDQGEIDFDEVTVHAFRGEMLSEVGLFRLPHLMPNPHDPEVEVVSWYQFAVVVGRSGEDFPALVAANKFRGIEFREVWSDG